MCIYSITYSIYFQTCIQLCVPSHHLHCYSHGWGRYRYSVLCPWPLFTAKCGNNQAANTTERGGGERGGKRASLTLVQNEPSFRVHARCTRLTGTGWRGGKNRIRDESCLRPTVTESDVAYKLNRQ